MDDSEGIRRDLIPAFGAYPCPVCGAAVSRLLGICDGCGRDCCREIDREIAEAQRRHEAYSRDLEARIAAGDYGPRLATPPPAASIPVPAVSVTPLPPPSREHVASCTRTVRPGRLGAR